MWFSIGGEPMFGNYFYSAIAMIILVLNLLSGCAIYKGGMEESESTIEEQCLATAFMGNQPDWKYTGTIVGAVMSPSETVPIAGATVTVRVDDQEAMALSVERGCFYLNLPKGKHEIVIEKGRYSSSLSAIVQEDEVTNLGAIGLDVGDVKVAVVFGKYDNVGELISQLGIPYDLYTSPKDLFTSSETLEDYDAVFINCGTENTTVNNEYYTETEISNVKTWVEAGGTIYISDWEHALFTGITPNSASFMHEPRVGPSGVVEATILDRNIMALLGTEQLDIHFQLAGWAVIDEVDEGSALLEADIDDQRHPLAVIDWPGQGRVIYTSFHNEEQLTVEIQTVLYELILVL
jgi:hypothetical protein